MELAASFQSRKNAWLRGRLAWSVSFAIWNLFGIYLVAETVLMMILSGWTLWTHSLRSWTERFKASSPKIIPWTMWQWHCTRARTKWDWNRLEQWSWYELIWADIVSWTSWRCSNSEESIRVETYRKPPCTSTLHFQGKQFQSQGCLDSWIYVLETIGNPKKSADPGSVRVRHIHKSYL